MSGEYRHDDQYQTGEAPCGCGGHSWSSGSWHYTLEDVGPTRFDFQEAALPTMDGREVIQRAIRGLPVEVLVNGEWVDAQEWLDRNSLPLHARPLEGIQVVARVKSVSTWVSTPVAEVEPGQVVLVDGQEGVVDLTERVATVDQVFYKLHSSGFPLRRFEPGELVEVRA